MNKVVFKEIDHKDGATHILCQNCKSEYLEKSPEDEP